MPYFFNRVTSYMFMLKNHPIQHLPKMHLPAAVLLLLGVAFASASPDLSICDPANFTGPYNGPPLPKLPNQYRVDIEGNIANRGYSVLLTEYYDEPNNRGAAISVHGPNMKSHISYDYTLNQTVHVTVDENGQSTCRIGDLSSTSFSIYGFHMTNGTSHINGTDAVFRFGPEYNETYLGNTTRVRGILTNHWQRCVYDDHSNKTFLLDFYFSLPGLKMPYDANEVPLRATINGSAYNHTTGDRRTFSHSYEYFNLKPGPVDIDRAFEPPLGVHCPGYKRTKKFPDIPSIFSQDVESVFPKYNSIHYTKELYNLKGKLVAYLYEPWANYSSLNTNIRREVHDYNSGLAYMIDIPNGTCKIGPIPSHTFWMDVETVDGKNVSLRSPHNFFFHDVNDWVYEGNTTLRDVDAEAWIGAGQHTEGNFSSNYTMEYYFGRGDWHAGNKFSGLIHQMPLRMEYTSKGMFNGTNFTMEFFQNMYHFSSHTPNFMFDVGMCYDESDSRNMAVDVVDVEGIGLYQHYVVNNTHAFYAASQHALADAAGLPTSRISKLYVVEGEEEILTIYFLVLGVPPVKGDAVNMTDQIPLSTAVANLESRLSLNTPVRINFTKSGEDVSLPMLKGSLRVDFHPESDMGQQGLSTGTVAGIGIGMFIFGGLVATVITLLYMKRVMAPPVPYGVQD